MLRSLPKASIRTLHANLPAKTAEHAQPFCRCVLTMIILVPRGRAPFGQHQKSRPLARSNDIPVLNGFVNTIDWDQNQSHLSNLTLSMRRVTGSPWIADFRCWTWPEVVIFGADQKERGLWGREWTMITMRKSTHGFPFLSYMSTGLRLVALRAAGAPL